MNETTHRKPSRRGPIAVLIAGAVLCLAPFVGLIGTVLGMIGAFQRQAQSEGTVSTSLSSDINAAIWRTGIGCLVVPLGIALVIVGIVWLVRAAKRNKEANTEPAGQG